MFIAEKEQGDLINLMLYTKDEIAELPAQEWRCRSCKQRLMLKNGPLKVAHFAHHQNSQCQCFSEGETAEHLSGKQLLANWCEKYQLKYELEAYLPELRQRPDVLVNDKIALEFQCSSLPLERLVERTENYQRHGYQVIWLLGQHFFVNQKLSVIQRGCLAYHQKSGFYLWELDVRKERISCLMHMEEIQASRRCLYRRKQWSVGSCSPVTLFNFPEQHQMFIKRQYQSLPLVLTLFNLFDQLLIRKDSQTLLMQEQFYLRGYHLRALDIVFFYLSPNRFLLKPLS